MFEKVLITDEERQMFPKWTVLDEDLADVDPVLAEQVLESRLEFFRETSLEPTTGMILKESTSSPTSST